MRAFSWKCKENARILCKLDENACIFLHYHENVCIFLHFQDGRTFIFTENAHIFLHLQGKCAHFHENFNEMALKGVIWVHNTQIRYFSVFSLKIYMMEMRAFSFLHPRGLLLKTKDRLPMTVTIWFRSFSSKWFPLSPFWIQLLIQKLQWKHTHASTQAIATHMHALPSTCIQHCNEIRK